MIHPTRFCGYRYHSCHTKASSPLSQNLAQVHPWATCLALIVGEAAKVNIEHFQLPEVEVITALHQGS